MLGLESATVPAGKVEDPARTIPRATLVGTALTALIYVVACTTVILLIPAARLAESNAPFAEVASMFWGNAAGQWIAAFAVISGFGALNGWILLQGEVPLQMAKNGVFPKVFARQSRRQTPVWGLVIGSVLMTLILLANADRSTVQLFSFVILLATAASLVLYLACSLAVLKLLKDGRMPARRGMAPLAVVGALAAAYSLWAIYGAGLSTGAKACGGSLVCWAPWSQNPVLLGLVLLALGIPVYFLMRRRRT
jgi:APA family basic amino acid/polyamine antiporter